MPLPAALAKARIDGFILAILAAVAVATLLPAQGAFAAGFDVAIKVAIAVLFFMYGGRLSSQEALAGLTHWRLHLTILACTYVAFPLVGVALRPLQGRVLPDLLFAGVLYLCAIPSTVQSSITFTSIARGNVAGAIVSASLSNLLGVVLTPAVVLVTMSASGGIQVGAGAIVDLVVQILLPFVAGQASRRWTAQWLAANNSWLKLVDRGVIVAVVYSAFSRGMREHMWSMVSAPDLAVLTVLLLALLAFMLWFTRALATRLGFGRGDRIAIQFCGTKKSLATGLPMALVLFPGQPVGLLVLPLMIFHQAQLMACSVIAQRYGNDAEQVGGEASARPG